MMRRRINDGLTNHERYRLNHPEYDEKFAEKKRKIIKILREEIFELLGNKCSNLKCPIPRDKLDIRALQIDHVNGNGQKERKIFQADYRRYYEHVLEQIKAGSKDYQLLCANCNWIKRYNKGEI